VVKGAFALVALGLDVPHAAEHIFERTFQVAEDASLVHALLYQQPVRGHKQVVRSPDVIDGEIHRGVIHVFPSKHERVVERAWVMTAI